MKANQDCYIIPCGCKHGVQRDNCPVCDGTGWRIDFAAIRARKWQEQDDANARAIAEVPAMIGALRGIDRIFSRYTIVPVEVIACQAILNRIDE